MKQTRGQYMIGTGFNPSKDSDVDNIKQHLAEAIDMIDKSVPMQSASTPTQVVQQQEKYALKEQAIRTIENAAMFAVKAITKPELEI